jgi:hypothetical protein
MRSSVWKLVAAGLISISLAFCQETRATISGRVSDPSGAGLANAPVRIVNTGTKTEFTARTNNDGLFNVPYLLPGTYDVTVEQPGFKKLERNNVALQLNDTVSLQLQLALGDVSQSVVVTADVPLLQTADPGLGQVVEEKQMAELPNPSGNSVEFQLLAPGMVNAGSIAVHEAAFNNGTSTIMANGNTSRSNEYAIDGIPNMMADGVQPRVGFSAPQGAIAEVKVMTTFYDAAMGHTPGAVINMITVSGTNLYHGDLHEYIGGSFFNANDFFANGAGQKRPVYRDNRFGGSFTGPVWIPKVYQGKNKTFFSYVYEPHKWNQPEQFTNTIPTSAERSGDLSALLKLGAQYQIYNPFSTTTTGNGVYTRQPVAGNVIPASLLNPIAVNIAKYWPQPNTAGRVDGSNNLVFYGATNEDYYVDFLRMDHYFSERNRTFVRLDYDYWEEHKADNQEYNNISTGLVLNRINRGLAIDHVFVINASSILDLRYGITQQDFPEARRSKGFDLSTLGFSPSLTSLIKNPSLATFPYISFSSFSGFGNWETGDGANTSLLHDWNATLTMLKGAHSIKYGGDFRINRNFQNRYPYDVSPALSFGATYTQGISTGYSSAIGQDLASFLFGVPTGGSMQQTASFADQDLFFAAFIQDDWKVTPKLTVNFGMRIEHETPVTERFNRAILGFEGTVTNPLSAQALANYAKSPVSGIPSFQVLGGLDYVGGSNGRSLWSGQSIEYLPRIGLAYQVAPKTVIRTGFGMYYDTLGIYRSPAIQTGFTASTPLVASYNNGVTYAASFANPFPTGLIAPSGTSLGLATNLGQAITVYPNYRPLPYAERWSFDLQREMPGGFLLDLAYVGNHAVHLSVTRQLNNTPLQYLSTSPTRDQTAISYLTSSFTNPFYGLNSVYSSTTNRATLLEPYPEFGAISETDQAGKSHYNALQLQAIKRFARGFTLKGSYTFSKLLDATSFLNNADPEPWYGVSQYDHTYAFSVTGVWELPFGKGRAFARSVPRVVDGVIGGWQVSTMTLGQSGDPLTWGNDVFNGDINNINLPGSKRTVSEWFNTASGFVTSAALQLADNVRMFPLRFAGIRGPQQFLMGVSAAKSFPIHERLNFQLRIDSYNVLNHPNFNDPNLTVTSGAFGQITAMNGYPRNVQLAARLRF